MCGYGFGTVLVLFWYGVCMVWYGGGLVLVGRWCVLVWCWYGVGMVWYGFGMVCRCCDGFGIDLVGFWYGCDMVLV